MKKHITIPFLALLLFSLNTVFAQKPTGYLARFTILKPKVGMEVQFEEGYKRHLEWHLTNADSWNWYGWYVVSGTRRGQFIDATIGRSWADFDSPVNPSADRADNLVSVLPFAEITTQYTTTFQAEFSRVKDTDLVAPLQNVVYLKLNPASETSFKRFLAEFMKQAATEQSFLWYRIEDGDDTPQYFVLMPRNNFAEFGKTENLFERVFERSDAARIAFRDSVRDMRVEVMRHRADLSYFPKKQ